MDDYSDFSLDDLLFEVKRLKQRSQVLEDDKRILQEELDIAKSGSSQAAAGGSNEDRSAMEKNMVHLRSLVTMFSQKYRVVQTFLLLERKALKDVREELDSGLQTVHKDSEQKLALVVKAVQHREYGLQKKLQGLAIELLKEKEKVEKTNAEFAEAMKENNKLVKTLSQTKEDFESERGSMKEHFDRINGKIDAYQEVHAEEVRALQEEIRTKDQAQIDLENKCIQMQKQVEIMNLSMSKLKDTHVKQVEELEKQCEDHVITINSLRKNGIQVDDQLKTMTEDNASLKKKIGVLKEQQEKLLQSHDEVSNDLRSVLAREESLRMELHGTSSDKGDMQRRLKSITDKVHSMEAAHQEEMKGLNGRLEEAGRTIALLEKDLTRENKLIESGKSALNKAQAMITERDGVISVQNEEIDKLKGEESQLRIYLKERMESMEKELKSSASDILSLRADRDEALERTKTLTADLSSLRLKNDDQEREIEILKQKLHDAENVTKVDEDLLRAIDEKEAKLQECKSEIAGLKDTIRRECEERTEMMIEMSELRDQIRRLSSLNLRSQSSSSGVDSGQQAGGRDPVVRRDDSRTSLASTFHNDTGGSSSANKKKGVSMLSQLAAEAGSAAPSEPGGMSDAAWSQRLAKQGSSGVNTKGKRKSQYR
jgi:chromosome segregation ATPase